MAYELSEINRRALAEPRAFIEECDSAFQRKIQWAADTICENMKKSPIVLLSGPSGSGKTTTAVKIEEELNGRGVQTHTVAMDNYYMDVTDFTPKTAEGDHDLESPDCLDMDLMNRHFTILSQGGAIDVPRYNFAMQRRSTEASKTLRLGRDEIAIFEGIHALNDSITSVHPEAFKLYISARSNIMDGRDLRFKGTWMRLVRRMVRDNLFRGANPNMTLGMWANIRRGEKAYISPYKEKADLMFDSSLPYEVCVMKAYAPGLLETVPQATERFEEIRSIVSAFGCFADIDPEFVKPNSLIREFIGGGIYDS